MTWLPFGIGFVGEVLRYLCYL